MYPILKEVVKANVGETFAWVVGFLLAFGTWRVFFRELYWLLVGCRQHPNEISARRNLNFSSRDGITKDADISAPGPKNTKKSLLTLNRYVSDD